MASSIAPGSGMEDALVAAAGQAGIRLTLLDTLYLGGGAGSRPLEPAQRRFADASVEAWAKRRDAVHTGPIARMGSAIHSVRAVPAELFAAVGAASVGMPLHAHLSEQKGENVTAIVATGRTPTELIADAGLLGPTFTAVHGTHLGETDIDLLGNSTSTVCFCPTTERDLADGIGPAIALRDAGAKLSLGSDQNAVIDPFEELRGLELDERLASGERGRFSPAELLTAATANGYASLGWNGGSHRGRRGLRFRRDRYEVGADRGRRAGPGLVRGDLRRRHGCRGRRHRPRDRNASTRSETWANCSAPQSRNWTRDLDADRQHRAARRARWRADERGRRHGRWR